MGSFLWHGSFLLLLQVATMCLLVTNTELLWMCRTLEITKAEASTVAIRFHHQNLKLCLPSQIGSASKSHITPSHLVTLEILL